VLVVIDQKPVASALPVPTITAPSDNVTKALASALPVNVGVVTLVVLSVFDAPLSDAADRSGLLGVAGTAVSILTDSSGEAPLTLPVRSVACARITWNPSFRAAAVTDQIPLASA